MSIAAVYSRKSNTDERSAGDGASVERQIEHATAFARAKLGATVVEQFTYADRAISGAEFERREGLQRLLKDIKRKPFDYLIISEPSRLGREKIETAYVLKQITDAGVKVYGYLDGRELTMGSSSEKLMFSVQAMAAEAERERGRQRTRDALIRKAKSGHFTGQKTYGYTTERVGEHTERRVDPEQATIVRKIFQMASEGHGDLRIANALRAEGAPAPRQAWSKEVVRNVLKNELYVGRVTFGRSRSVDKGGRVGGREKVAPADWVRVDVPALRIIDEALWTKVRDRKAKTLKAYVRLPNGQRQSKPEAGLVARFALSGIAKCGTCGGSLAYRGKGKSYYCLEHCRGRGCTNGRGVPIKRLDALVITTLKERLDDPDVVWDLVVERAQRWKRKHGSKHQERRNLEKEVARREAEVARLVSALAAGKGASADITSAIAERRARIEALRAKLAEPVTLDVDRTTVYKSIGPILGMFKDCGDAEPAAVRSTLRRLGISKIVVTPDGAGWKVEGIADLALLLGANGAPGGGRRRAVDR